MFLTLLTHQELNQLACTDHFGLLPSFGKVTSITGDEVVRTCSLRAPEENIVVGVAASLDTNAGLDPMT